MPQAVDYILIIILLTDLIMLAATRLGLCVRVVGFQGFLAGLLPLLATERPFGWWSAAVAALVIGLKGFLFPILLTNTLKTVDIRRELEPYVSPSLSVLLGVCFLLGAHWACLRLPFPTEVVDAPVGPTIAMFTVFTGLFLIVSRLKALTQVIGYIVFENGVYILGTVLLVEQALVVELGILLDLLVVIFIMGIAISHINEAFDHIDTSQMDA